jgi:myo-inositol-1(or 4)-monophosphatase
MAERDPPPTEILAARLEVAAGLAREAGALVLDLLGRALVIAEKGPLDLVTAADRASEAMLLERLRAAYPSDLLLGEESDGKLGARERAAAIRQAPFCWVVDPLDGTTNFAHGYLDFGVSVGLLAWGRPVLGAIAVPARGEIFTGGLGLPAALGGRPIRVSAVASVERALVATGFPYDRRQRMPQLLLWVERILMRTHGLRRSGAATVDLCNLAAGRLEGFFEAGLAPWDLTAGQAIVEAAGGRVTGFDGGEHDVFAANTVASNGLIHEALREVVVGGA